MRRTMELKSETKLITFADIALEHLAGTTLTMGWGDTEIRYFFFVLLHAWLHTVLAGKQDQDKRAQKPWNHGAVGVME